MIINNFQDLKRVYESPDAQCDAHELYKIKRKVEEMRFKREENNDNQIKNKEA